MKKFNQFFKYCSGKYIPVRKSSMKYCTNHSGKKMNREGNGIAHPQLCGVMSAPAIAGNHQRKNLVTMCPHIKVI